MQEHMELHVNSSGKAIATSSTVPHADWLINVQAQEKRTMADMCNLTEKESQNYFFMTFVAVNGT